MHLTFITLNHYTIYAFLQFSRCLGLVRNENGVCVRPHECKTTVAFSGMTTGNMKCNVVNEVYMECGSDCGRHCHELEKSKMALQCFSCSVGCYCDKGFYRSYDGKCVEESKCLAKNYELLRDCGLNEEFSHCGSACGTNCSDVHKPNLMCTQECKVGCFCKKDHFRNKKGICIPKDRCDSSQCPSGEEYSKCGKHCGESCEEQLKGDLICDRMCEEGCFCLPGTYRNADGVCVKKIECNSQKSQSNNAICPSNEEFTDCGNSCKESCDSNTICTQECQRGCFCIAGMPSN
jgi:hypothetical protein